MARRGTVGLLMIALLLGACDSSAKARGPDPAAYDRLTHALGMPKSQVDGFWTITRSSCHDALPASRDKLAGAVQVKDAAIWILGSYDLACGYNRARKVIAQTPDLTASQRKTLVSVLDQIDQRYRSN